MLQIALLFLYIGSWLLFCVAPHIFISFPTIATLIVGQKMQENYITLFYSKRLRKELSRVINQEKRQK